MNPPLLSAALIVRNEEQHLAQCLASIRPVADEVVVVDTGSTDRTREIAIAAGARVYEFRWTDDFAAARNESLRLATSQWILYIDADERLNHPAPSELRRQLADPALIGLRVLLHARPGWTPYWELRIFRNDPAIRFQGVIHENIWPALQAFEASHGGGYARSGAVLNHIGYEGDQDHKHRRNLPLLEESLRHDPDRFYNWCHLARVYEATGRDVEAGEAWEGGIEAVHRRDTIDDSHSFPYIGLIERKIRMGQDAGPLLEKARDLFPCNQQIRWLQARVWMQQGRFEDAARVFRDIIRRGEEADYEMTIGYDERLFGVLSYDSLATCYFRMKRYADSREFFDRAAEREPANTEYRVKRDLCASLLASSAGAC